MEKTYDLNDCIVHVTFEPKVIRVQHPEELDKYLQKDIDLRTTVLANLIKTDYELFFHTPLRISSPSLVVEIWAHAFAGFIAKWIKKKFNFGLAKRLSNFVINKSHRIDCGERSVDSNRIVWDILSHFKQSILWFIPKRMK